MENRKIAVIGLGGTISMTDGGSGLIPSQTLDEILSRAIPDPMSISTETIDLMQKPSASLSFDDLLHIAKIISKLDHTKYAGVVIIQGTDTLEETAFAIELLVNVKFPIIFTGAMRGAAQPGCDGPSNLVAALKVAAYATNRPEVYIVLNDEIHLARYVIKAHTSALNAFTSSPAGPLMRIHEGKVREPIKWTAQPLPKISLTNQARWPRVTVLPLVLGDDGEILEHLQAIGYQGCVLEAMGGGHAPASIVDKIERLANQMPVVLCSRAQSGQVFEDTYGYSGSEKDLIGRGLISGGIMNSLKARILLLLCLAENADHSHKNFSNYLELISVC